MIVTELYNGQGLGNQLWSYVVLRALAADKGFEFGIMSPHKFKGSSFLNLDFGCEVVGGEGPEGGPPISLPEGIDKYYVEPERWLPTYRCDVRDFDPKLLEIEDGTKIEGYFQSEQLISGRRNEIREWLKVIPSEDRFEFSRDDICVLNIRGGEYKGNADLLLREKYWRDAMANMLRIRPGLRFIAITDDVAYARNLLPDIESFHFSIGGDYSVVKNAHYLILANSSFSFFPAWTSTRAKAVIAPKYWARHNVSDGFWACSFNIYSGWLWQDRKGKLFSADECRVGFEKYRRRNRLDCLTAKTATRPQTRFEELRFKIHRKIEELKG